MTQTIEEKAAYNAAWCAAHKEERAAYCAAYREAHKEELAAYRAAYNEARTEERAAYYAAHKKKQAAYRKAHAEQQHAAVVKHRALYPEREAARKAVGHKVERGHFPPANTMVCDLCGEALAFHWHHHNGYGPGHELDVIAVCRECHGKAHRKTAGKTA